MDQPSSAPKKWKKKGGDIIKFVRDLIKRPKSANDSTGQFHPTQVSGSPAFVAHVPGNDSGSAEPTASGKYIDSIL